MAPFVFGTVSAAIAFLATGVPDVDSARNFMFKNYPPTALKNGEEGRVGFRVDISDQGRIEQCAVTESSGYATLDRETCDFIAVYAGFSPVRDAKGNRLRATQTGFINWKLPPGVTRSAAPKTAATALPPPLLCKRTDLTGSTRKKVTRCMTAAEWSTEASIVNTQLEELVGRRHCTPEGC